MYFSPELTINAKVSLALSTTSVTGPSGSLCIILCKAAEHVQIQVSFVYAASVATVTFYSVSCSSTVSSTNMARQSCLGRCKTCEWKIETNNENGMEANRINHVYDVWHTCILRCTHRQFLSIFCLSACSFEESNK